VRLHSEHSDAGDGRRRPRLVLLHGFTQTARCWGPVLDDLAADHDVVRFDAPGHGGSSAVRADLPTTARLVAEAAGPAVYLGYSMGARLALHVALDQPQVVRGLVLVGGTAGIEDPAERRQRVARDEALAARLRSDGVDTFLDDWLRLPLFAGLPGWARFDDERRRNTADGLASSLELAGTGAQEPRWDELGEIAGPVLVTAGADDARFAALARRMAAAVGADAEVALVPDAGHAAHLEQPERFVALLRPWLEHHAPSFDGRCDWGAPWARGTGHDATS
jgi:2-succinyl-6-hydroxy-2,4-cyclohexadiene-1-carboxylate synthase